jgi:hypothetical protein
MYLIMHDSKIISTYVCGQVRGLRTDFCGLRTDFCGHTADTADKIADTLRTLCVQTADSGHNFFVAERYLVSLDNKYLSISTVFLLNADTLRTHCGHTADSGQIFADTLRTLRTKLRTLRTKLRTLVLTYVCTYYF